MTTLVVRKPVVETKRVFTVIKKTQAEYKWANVTVINAKDPGLSTTYVVPISLKSYEPLKAYFFWRDNASLPAHHPDSFFDLRNHEERWSFSDVCKTLKEWDDAGYALKRGVVVKIDRQIGEIQVYVL